jgi:glycosyltransferase involved in cell wall biosynthesis
MKKVVVSYNTARYLYRFRLGILLGLIKRNYKLAVIAPLDEYSCKLKDIGCDVYDIPMNSKGSNPLGDARSFFAYLKIYKKIQPDLALHFTIKPNIYGTLAARSLGVRCINMVTGVGTAFINDSWLTRIVEKLYKLSQPWASKVLFQNRDDMELFVKRGLVSIENVEILSSSGINLTEFSATPLANNVDPIFLLIGRMLGDKGIFEFVDAARLLKEIYPNVRFQLLGQLDVVNRTVISRYQMDSWVNEGVVEYLGETDDVRPYIANADCVVLPSYREGLSKTLLEAAAMSRPIVATDVPGCRDVVDDGISGYLCKVRDVSDLVSKMESIILLSRQQRTEMGFKGREKMQREFDADIILERYLQLVEDTLR